LDCVSELKKLRQSLATDCVSAIHDDLLKVKHPHFDIAYRLADAKMSGYPELLGYKDVYELSEKEFGFQRSSTAAYIAVYDEYFGFYPCDCPRKRFLEYEVLSSSKWLQFSFSQLVEMLPLDDYDRGLIKPEMTIKQIREWRQNHKFVTLESGDCVMYGELSERQRREYADYKERQKAERCADKSEVDDLVQTSGQENCSTADSNLQDFEKDIVYSPCDSALVSKSSLLHLRSKAEREDFLSKYKSWGVWLSVPELELTCYKFKFANGDELVVSESYYWCDPYYSTISKCMQVRYHLIDVSRTFFDLSGIAKTYVLDYMTKHSKEI